jgi:IclR family transcriptional regulator, pca regulon regulatory protein
VEEDEQDRDDARPFPTLPEPRYSRSLERGLAILACFTPQRPVLGIAEVADSLGMSRATTHRYMSTLVAQGYLQRDGRKYRLGLGAVDLGLTTLGAMGLCNHARPDLQELAKQTRQRAELAVLDGAEILVLESIGRQRAREASEARAGARLPAYCTSMGKILLAHLPEKQRTRLVAETELVKRGPKTITSRTTLIAQLAQARKDELAIDDEERTAGSCALAAPLRDESGDVIAAVSVAAYGGALDVEDLLNRYASKLVATAERISRRLGWPGELD